MLWLKDSLAPSLIPPTMTPPLRSPGLSKNGKNRPANPTSNGKWQPSSPKNAKDSSKHSNSPPGKSTTQEEVAMGGTTTGVLRSWALTPIFRYFPPFISRSQSLVPHSFPYAPLGPSPNHLTSHLIDHMTNPQSTITCHHSAVRSIMTCPH